MNNIKPFQVLSEKSIESEGSDRLPSIEKGEPEAFTHYQKTKAALAQNEFLNSLFLNQQLSKKAKAIIAKEIKNYV